MAKDNATNRLDVEGLREMLEAERARLRWRLETRTPDEDDDSPEEQGRPRGKLYRVFRTCIGD